MRRRFVRQGDNRFGIFSDVVDDFVLEDATRDEVLSFLLNEHREELERTIGRLLDGHPLHGKRLWTASEIADELRAIADADEPDAWTEDPGEER